MDLRNLHAIHFLKKEFIGEMRAFKDSGLLFESCQRFLWLSFDKKRFIQEKSRFLKQSGTEFFEGSAAYEFLLQMATGLESELVGEADVFGQLKAAWRQFEILNSETELNISNFRELFHILFADTKEVRQNFLQNIGGMTYGSLVRKVLRSKAEAIGLPLNIQKTALIGAGQLGAALAPYLSEFDLQIWNRSEANLRNLLEEVTQKTNLPTTGFSAELGFNEDLVWKNAHHVVICVPECQETDPRRVMYFSDLAQKNCTVLHLGMQLVRATSPWEKIPGLLTLRDIFDIQKANDSVRNLQISAAKKACIEKSALRALGVNSSVPHGWEDLAVFV
jgi:hypothetical protein